MWRFKEVDSLEPERDPHEAEFFNTGNLDPSNSLVRESIQNSLDASKEDGPVRVKYTISEIKNINDTKYFKLLKEHLDSANLMPGNYNSNKMRVLAIEDFNTVGLDGVSDRSKKGSDESNFINFWWREGKSEKKGTNAGRWGLGKIVYSVTSNLRTFWGYTLRDDNRRLLMGKTVLKTHNYNDTLYNYYGYFMNEDGSPIEDDSLLDEFIDEFNLSRKSDTGLSIAIPMPDRSINEESLIKASIMQYFFPIIKENLIVEIEGENFISLNAHNIIDIALNQNWKDTSWENRDVEKLMEFVEDVATKPVNDGNYYVLKDPVKDGKINGKIGKERDQFEGFLDEAIDSFENSKLLCFEIPVFIKPADEERIKSHFRVYIKKDKSLKKSDEFYIRSGIYVSDIRMLRNKSVRGLLYAGEKPVSMFLGDSESPSHTDWKERREDFKEKYEYHRKTLRYIRGSIRDIVNKLNVPSEEVDENFLQDLFSVNWGTKPEGGDSTKRDTFKGSENSNNPLFVSKIDQGFHISSHSEVKDIDQRYKIEVAYEIRKGNPFKNYNSRDFDLNNDDVLSVEYEGIDLRKLEDNIIEFIVENDECKLNIRGFDVNRDLVLDISEVN
ncbi:MAG: hypothetical protein ACOCRX_05290 [Candidatus Woesearchaeota archaeon]